MVMSWSKLATSREAGQVGVSASLSLQYALFTRHEAKRLMLKHGTCYQAPPLWLTSPPVWLGIALTDEDVRCRLLLIFHDAYHLYQLFSYKLLLH